MADTEMEDESSIFKLEYRNKDDDAWYTVRIALSEGNGDEEMSLIVKFQGFTEVADVKYSVGQFKSAAEVDDLVKRFRPLSEQFQDRECRKLKKGMRVCAALSCQDDDLRYYDAVVEAKKFASSHYASNSHASASRGSSASCEESGSANDSGVELQIVLPYSDSDEDLGGDDIVHRHLGGNDVAQSDGLHIVLINNLETDLSPSTIRQFIHEHTSISPQAFTFPSQLSNPYASGAIVLDSETKLEKIFKFLNNPENIIISARGRPWIITGKMLWHGTFGSSAHILELEYEGKFQKSNMNRELQVVHSGTEAYKRAKQLRELFMDFMDHLNRIHKNLAFKEAKILQSFQ